MKTYLFVFIFSFLTLGLTSCSVDSDLEIPEYSEYAVGGEIDDPIEPDEDD